MQAAIVTLGLRVHCRFCHSDSRNLDPVIFGDLEAERWEVGILGTGDSSYTACVVFRVFHALMRDGLWALRDRGEPLGLRG